MSRKSLILIIAHSAQGLKAQLLSDRTSIISPLRNDVAMLRNAEFARTAMLD